ncbi:hypothetical protein PPACK8108_LOCUS22146 [Phakopsora pachyrhizi]|uniref:Uncharacterized protein n=1 Tax=Phakopsora pachyrhizi TaxID=170000 RepID=A0AAV0BL97_PHAPC|nr:hypothetical protein PPACK8108_LOCUS22146 [Phakopsora pachyrhizi]
MLFDLKGSNYLEKGWYALKQDFYCRTAIYRGHDKTSQKRTETNQDFEGINHNDLAIKKHKCGLGGKRGAEGDYERILDELRRCFSFSFWAIANTRLKIPAIDSTFFSTMFISLHMYIFLASDLKVKLALLASFPTLVLKPHSPLHPSRSETQTQQERFANERRPIMLRFGLQIDYVS